MPPTVELLIELVFWGSVAAVATTYFVYPVSLILLARQRRSSPQPGDPTPAVTMIISAYNEAEIIGEKIENTLALDYPSDRLRIMVISDASDDGTDEIVSSYADRGVKLCRQEQRRGKSAGLTRFVPEAFGEIVVFSDANSIYESSALRHLVEHFGSPEVGYVVGHQMYAENDQSAVTRSEGLYWKYEGWLKRYESRVSSVVGGDGAIYAVRKPLFQPLRDDDISDFVNPLQVVARGYRGVYAGDAICYEPTANSFGGEFRRKVRIVNRSLRGLLRVPETLNPLRVGWFAYQVAVHKLLRWFVPCFLAGMLLSSLVLAATSDKFIYPVMLALQLGGYAVAAARGIPVVGKLRVVYTAYYFCVVNAAAGLGIATFLAGKRFATWAPERNQAGVVPDPASRPIRGPFVLGSCCAALLTLTILGLVWPLMAYWLIMAILVYVVIGYLGVLVLLPFRKANDGSQADLPTVTLIIPAHNEESVLQKKLENALSLDYPRDKLEILVASDASTDRTVEIASRFQSPALNVLDFRPRRGKATMVNEAARVARGDVLCLCDANVFFRADAMRQLVAGLANPQVGAVSGQVRLQSVESNFEHGEDLYYQLERTVQAAESRVSSLIGVDGGMYAVRRELFQPLPADTILDDFVISMRVVQQHKRVCYQPRAIADESGTPSGRQEYRRRVRVAAGAIQALKRGEFPSLSQPFVFWQFLSHKLLRWLGPALLLILLVSNVLLWSRGAIYQFTLIGQLLVYGLALLSVCSVRLRCTRLGGISYYFAISHVAMLVGYVKGLFNLQPVTWRRTERSATAGLPESTDPHVTPDSHDEMIDCAHAAQR